MRRVEFMLGGEDFKKMTAAHFMESDVYYYSQNAPATELINAMTRGGFGSLPIVAPGKVLVGIVSEYDLLNAIMAGRDLKTLTAGEIMTADPVTISEETPAQDILAILQAKHFIRVPVVDENRVLVGVVARRDILLGFKKSIEKAPQMAFNLL
ncbi:MAG: CBS domain-containing protein [Candidatus Manganitrophus sp.]|nr:CBS domain-containing protein [Candidatus Manganitrophus sp.]MDC4227613.1 CBS domain-containing protein [Candidatus Manganitrophus sp.]WDT70738.1 MAG: CBS domain-containing protein [Candidatus Manganitrophus sp.]WDT81995.1 MAG: CBS domain-containing protein [Candidatus Manganitrophus sp.]